MGSEAPDPPQATGRHPSGVGLAGPGGDRGAGGDPSLAVAGHLDPGEVAEVLSLVAAATEVDGVAPLSEHVLLHLRAGGEEPGLQVLLREADTTLAGYAHLDPTDLVSGPSAEVVVHPGHRRRGHGRRLVDQLERLADAPLRLWAHGHCSAARQLAASLGYESIRELWQMRRSLHADLPRVTVPEGVRLRTFTPEDAAAVLAVNAAAFADHPEQGRWTRTDLDTRLTESWFDPAGLFLAEATGEVAGEAPRARAAGATPDTGPAGSLLGFHWTKVHGASSGSSAHAHEPIGEVYVVGVAPWAQGRGLGRSLTLAGLHYLRQRGLSQVMLYVDADNTAAVRTYTRLGFARWDVDVQFREPSPS